MTKFSVDYTGLEQGLTKKTYKFSEVSHRLRKVAFDIVRFEPEHDSTIDGLWKIENTPDGEVIVALYDDTAAKVSTSSEKISMASVNNWNLIPDSNKSSVSIFYKNEYVTKISTASIGIPKEETNTFADYMAAKLASDKNVTSKLIADLPVSEKNQLVRKFPELKI